MSEHTEGLGYSSTSRGTDSSVSSSSTSTSVIGPTLVVKGEVTAEEDLLVRGRVQGRIDHNQTLTVHAEGSVEAVVKAREIHIEGSVEGDLFGTERVKVCETGKVVGNVFAPRVAVMEGALFKGMVDMDSDGAAIERRYTDQVGKAKSKPDADRGPDASAQAEAPAAAESKSKANAKPNSRKNAGKGDAAKADAAGSADAGTDADAGANAATDAATDTSADSADDSAKAS